MSDMTFILVVLGFAIILSLIHYFGHMISGFIEKHHYKVLSFSGGTLIALIFLVLLPEVIETSESNNIYFFMLFGFIIFHISEKYLYQHVKDKKQKSKELKELHILGFFVDHFILGFVLVTLLELSGIFGLLILIPIFLQTLSSSLVMSHIHEGTKTNINKILLSSAPIFGALTALILVMDEAIQALILAFILGMMMYILGRDILPKEAKGSPAMFLIGLLLVTAIWLGLDFIVG
jgi:hypothetical protein